MLEINNNTPFATALIPALDHLRRNFAVVIIKGTFDFADDTRSIRISDEQVDIVQADEFYGEPAVSSVRYEADIAWVKRGVDVVLNGHAYAPNGRPAERLEAVLQINHRRFPIIVNGDRYWHKRGFQWEMSAPEPFVRMPICYENAFGGAVVEEDPGRPPDGFAKNPIGKGYFGKKGQGLQDGLPVPNIEKPSAPIRYRDDLPEPAGFGFIGRSWSPRLQYAGTYDESWQREKLPLLPDDFDERYHSGAHPDLILPLGSLSGAMIRAVNVSESGAFSFGLPEVNLSVEAQLKGKEVTFVPFLDTVVIEPDATRVMLTWRVAIPCKHQFLYVDKVKVAMTSGGL